jgi:Ran-binding protein 1
VCDTEVMPTSKLQEHTGSDKAWVWSAVDYADGEHKVELFCIRFGTPESKWPLLCPHRRHGLFAAAA